MAELDDDSIPDVPAVVGKRRKTKSEPKEEGEKTNRRKAKGTSTRGRIKELINEGWFQEHRTSKGVQEELGRRGHDFEFRRINEALKSFLQSKILDRDKSGSEWEYWNQ